MLTAEVIQRVSRGLRPDSIGVGSERPTADYLLPIVNGRGHQGRRRIRAA